MMQNKLVTIFGATGFIGEHITRQLARKGYRIRLACSQVIKGRPLCVNAQYVGQITPMTCNYNTSDIDKLIQGADIVVNCTGILFETKRRTFMGTHCDLPTQMAKSCANHGVKNFIHISALGVDINQSKYAQSKLCGEQAILKHYPTATILRPSVVFGAKDDFFNRFATMPVFPLIGNGKTLFQPIYAGDIAQAVCNTIHDNKTGIYELGGPQILSFKDLMKKLCHHTGQTYRAISIPFCIAKIMGFFAQMTPKPPLTLDQIRSLQYPNIVNDDAKNLSDLHVKPVALDVILPSYLEHYRN